GAAEDIGGVSADQVDLVEGNARDADVLRARDGGPAGDSADAVGIAGVDDDGAGPRGAVGGDLPLEQARLGGGEAGRCENRRAEAREQSTHGDAPSGVEGNQDNEV